MHGTSHSAPTALPWHDSCKSSKSMTNAFFQRARRLSSTSEKDIDGPVYDLVWNASSSPQRTVVVSETVTVRDERRLVNHDGRCEKASSKRAAARRRFCDEERTRTRSNSRRLRTRRSSNSSQRSSSCPGVYKDRRRPVVHDERCGNASINQAVTRHHSFETFNSLAT
jgi:hypothetical protein